MKRIIYITILALMLLAACTKPSPAPAPAPEQYSKYIFFSQNVETKATLIEDASDLVGESFGVLGFKYDSNTDWATYSTTTVNGKLPSPNVFYKDDNSGPVDDVETVYVTSSVDGTPNENEPAVGIASYTPLQGWLNDKKYAFFAFYPMPNDHVTLVNLDGNTPYSGGIPAVRYSNPNLDVSKMDDVMIANYHTDLFWHSSNKEGNNIPSGEVNFQFDHCLSCLVLSLKSTSEATITIQKITLSLSNVQYGSVIFPLDGDYTSVKYEKANESTKEIILEPPKIISEDYTDLSDLLILIPQDQDLSINLTVNYQRKYPDRDPYDAIFNTSTPLTAKLLKGKKHKVKLDFSDSNVFILQTNGEWTETTVPHEFN